MIRMRIHLLELSQQCWSPADHLSGQELKGGLQHPIWNKYKISLEKHKVIKKIEGGSHMTGTDLCVNKPHCAAAVRPWESEATTSASLLLGLEPVQSCLGVARVMSEQKVPRSVEQRIVIKFLGENIPSAEIHHRLQQQYGEECLLRRLTQEYVE